MIANGEVQTASIAGTTGKERVSSAKVTTGTEENITVTARIMTGMAETLTEKTEIPLVVIAVPVTATGPKGKAVSGAEVTA